MKMHLLDGLRFMWLCEVDSILNGTHPLFQRFFISGLQRILVLSNFYHKHKITLSCVQLNAGIMKWDRKGWVQVLTHTHMQAIFSESQLSKAVAPAQQRLHRSFPQNHRHRHSVPAAS